MARIWPVYEGREPTLGGPWASLPVSEAIALLRVKKDNFVSDLEVTPRFGDKERDLTWAGHKYVVVEISPSEARSVKWKPGFYLSPVPPREAYGLLIKEAIASALGERNVLRIEYEPTVDSQGEEAIRIKVILAPDAPQRIADGASLDALVKLRERLNELRDHRTPIVEYATEEELTQYGSH